jgi:cytochrome c-type biogenesis protein CcmH/NrfF
MPDLQQAAREAADLTEQAVSMVRGGASSVGDTVLGTAGDLMKQARPSKRRRRAPWPLAVAVLVIAAWMVARRARRPDHLRAVPT